MDVVINNYIIAYTDGSYYESGNFAGAAVFFENCVNEDLHVEQYMSDVWGERSALRAEIFAALLALRRSIQIQASFITIRIDCKDAKNILESIDPRSVPDPRVIFDPLLYMWWKLNQYIYVNLEWIPAHTQIPKNTQSSKFKKWVGNYRADEMAKRAANLTRYAKECRRMDENNPFYDPIKTRVQINTLYNGQSTLNNRNSCTNSFNTLLTTFASNDFNSSKQTKACQNSYNFSRQLYLEHVYEPRPTEHSFLSEYQDQNPAQILHAWEEWCEIVNDKNQDKNQQEALNEKMYYIYEATSLRIDNLCEFPEIYFRLKKLNVLNLINQ